MATRGGDEAQAATTRCPRADCTSLREELELLRGDLLELEGEHEQLHEQLATLQSEVSAKDTQAQKKLRTQEDEIVHLNETVHALTTQLQLQLELQSDRESSSNSPEKPPIATKDKEFEALQTQNEVLETRLKELQAQVEREASAGLKAQRQVAQVAEESKDKRSELYTALKENELLRDEAVELQEAVKKTTEQVKEYQVSMQTMQDQLEAYRDAVDEQTLEIAQLHTKAEQLEQEKLSVEAKLIEMDERESDVDALMNDAKEKFKMEKAVLIADLDELKRKLKQQQMLHEQQQQQVLDTNKAVERDEEEDTVRGSASAGIEDLEKQLEKLQELRIRDKSTILELNQRILQQQSDLESLAEHLDIEAVVESAVQAAVHQQKSRVETLEQESMTLKRRLKEQRELVQDLELRQGIVEKQLVEAEEWNAKYEQQAGLEDVVKYQKKLRAQLEQQQQMNVKLRQDLNDQVEATGKLYVAFGRLKNEAGKPAEFEYDDLAIADHLKGQLAINEAVMKQMEIQIHELEAERLRFLKKLRDQARLAGHKLYEQHGLTTEQWGAIEEFIDRVMHTPEVAKRMLQLGCEPMNTFDEEELARRTKDQRDAAQELERKLDIRCEENALLLKDIERLQNELDVARATPISLPVAQPPTSPDDVRGELLRALESAKVKSQRQEGVIYHLRAEIASLRKEREQKTGKKEVVFQNASSGGTKQMPDTVREKPTTELRDHVCTESQTSSRNITGNSKLIVQTQDISCGDDGDNSTLFISDDEGSANVVKTPKELEHSNRNQVPAESSRSHESSAGQEWSNHADNIALVVAKAIEAQFALLQAQTQTHTPLVSVPPIVSVEDAPAPLVMGPIHNKDEVDSKPANISKPLSPRSLASRAMVDNLAFESEEEMVQQVDFLRELNVCLDELVATEARNEKLQQQLHQHEDVFQSLMDQHTILYQHFFQMHAQYSNAEIRLRNELDHVTQENKDYKVKCQRYEAGLHLLGVQTQQTFTVSADALVSGNEAQLRSEVIELTRKTAAYEVNEARLKRKYKQLHTEWQNSKEHSKLLEREWSEMEKTLKYRVLYLETWKQGADEMIERMEKTLEKSVLREFADRQQNAMTDLLKKYNLLSESYAEMHAKCLELYDLPAQLSRTQHKLMILQAEKSARSGAGVSDVSCGPSIFQNRIDQLESELQEQFERVKALEEAGRQAMADDDWLVQSPQMKRHSGDDIDLRNENSLLYERINEVEQLYESLALECSKYKDIATLAASQANVLTKRAAQKQGNREQQEEQLRDLMASSEDHAIVGELQHQLMQIKTTYQQFLMQYDLITETQQQTLLRNQRLELEMEKKAQELSVFREKSSDKVQILENAIGQMKERDWTARNTKWEAFRKRLDSLEDEILVEQQRRKQLEKDLEDKQAQLPLFELKQQRGNQSEVGRLKSRVEALETRERLLMGQLESATKASGLKKTEIRLQTELRETKTLNEDMLHQLEAIQARVSELLRLNGELESEKRELRCKYEDLELELQYARSGITDVERREHDNQRDLEHGSSHSPLMRQKVGLYEKDQAELQQAAQATIASLKQLVEEKNTLINEYQRKLAVIRASSAQDKAQDRLETTQLNKKLYEENQRMIGQLKEAMSTISSMERSGKSKQALQAAQERHDHVLQEWKQAEVALEGTKQTVRELQMDREVLRNERDLAEARAGEALEEIVLLKEKIQECEKHSQKLEHQVSFVKQDVVKKEEKLKLLRDAIIKLKEEFLKAEDRHAIEIAKAQHTMNQDFNAKKRKEKERRVEEEDEWHEEKTRLQSQVQMLQEKLSLLKKKQDQQQRRRKQIEKEEKEEKESSSDVELQVLKEEVERLKRLLKEKVVDEARSVEELEKKIKILQAQNLALREASTHTAALSADVADEKSRRDKLEGERKLQRRVDILMLRLKEKQSDVISKDSEIERCNERILKLESELKVQQARTAKERLAQVSSTSAVVPASVKQQLEELERQNSFLQETLALKRKEWEDSFTKQMEKYEAQLQRLRRRLVQHGISSGAGDDDEADSAIGQGANLRLWREEQRFLVGQEVQEELLTLGDDMRSKEQEMVAKDTKLLELELEVESLRLEYKRLLRKNQLGGGNNSEDTLRQRRGTKGGGRGSTWTAQERLELEEVIENMKKVIEKLRADNEKLKKAAAKQASVSPERVESLRRKLKEQKDARERLEVQLEKLHNESGELKKDKLKLQQKLRAKSASTSSSKSENNALEMQLKDKDRQLLEAEREVTELRHQVLQLELQIERSVHVEADAESKRELEERVKELQAQVLELEDENTKLTNELAAFDEDFFEEIEDLKYKYTQAVRDKRQLERRLASKGSGMSPASSSSQRRSRS